MASKIKDALPSHMKLSANGAGSQEDFQNGTGRHHGKSQSHVVR